MNTLAGAAAARLEPRVMAAEARLLLDDWQHRVTVSPSKRLILNCSRQVGKSTTVGVRVAREMIYKPESLSIILAPTDAQSGELFRKAASVYKAMGSTVPVASESARRMELKNGSRLIALPGTEKSSRGYSGASLLVIDEASRVSDELYHTVRPMLATSGGSMILLSTPFGTRGFFYEVWQQALSDEWQRWKHTPVEQRGEFRQAPGLDEWERIAVPAYACPRIPADFIAEEQRRQGEWWFRQEYCCEFLEGMTSSFTREMVDGAFVQMDAWF